MDALHTSGDVRASARDLREAGAAFGSPRAQGAFQRSWLAAGLAILGLVAASWLSVAQLSLPVQILQTADGVVVEAVAVGSEAWASGVRPMSPAHLVEARSVVRIEVSPGMSPEYPFTYQGDFGDSLVNGLAVLLLAALVAQARFPGVGLLAGAGVAFALLPASPDLGIPAAIPLLLLPLATAGAATRIPDSALQRRFDIGWIVLVVALALAAMWLARNPVPLSWPVAYAVPLTLALSIGVTGEIVAVYVRLKRMPLSGQSGASRLLQALVPLAARSRLEGADEERSRLAIELHNSVLPKVRSSARAVRADATPEVAAQHIENLEAELRDVMSRYETVTLELSGVADALRVFVESLAAGGIRISLDTAGVTERRPPANVEMAAYRIGQAAIENALRHSSADHIEVTVSSRAQSAQLTVKDDGVGIDTTAESSARHRGRLGIAQMRVRAEAVGGKLDVRGKPGEGTEVRFTWSG
jgi:signal transduction histidine kinase